MTLELHLMISTSNIKYLVMLGRTRSQYKLKLLLAVPSKTTLPATGLEIELLSKFALEVTTLEVPVQSSAPNVEYGRGRTAWLLPAICGGITC